MATLVKGTPQVLISNSALPAVAPPSYFLPVSGVATLPPGCVSWSLKIDQTNVPVGATYSFEVQYQRLAAWTDKDGIVHPAGEWLLDASAQFTGGLVAGHGAPSFLVSVGSSIGARDSNGNMVEPYPDNVRVNVTHVGNWVFPSITLTLN